MIQQSNSTVPDQARQKYRSRCIVWAASMSMCLAMTGCASGPQTNPRDPLEPFNRGVFRFNDTVDRAVLKPVAIAYRDVTPALVRTGVGNFFGNLEDIWSIPNNLLQFKGVAAIESLLRVGVNTVLGLAGVLDIASEMGIERHSEDFGQTLGHWGVGAGPYVVLPLLGPSTLRDTAALAVDSKGDAVQHIGHVPTRNSAKALSLVDLRASLLRASSVIEGAALDPYTFTRDAHLQRRLSAVFDGNPPEEETEVKSVP